MNGRAAAAGAVRSLLAALALAAALPAAADTLQEGTYTPSPAATIHGLALGAYAGGGVSFAASPYFPLKTQPWWSSGLALELAMGSQLGLGLSLGYHQAAVSSAAAGWVYRGYLGLEAGAYLFGRGPHPTASERLELVGGLAVGASARFDTYTRTELLFFYPSLWFEPYLEFHSPRLGRHTLSLGLPNQIHFRKDMDMSASLGLNVRWRWYPGWNKERQ
jgi:hypothetical protein